MKSSSVSKLNNYSKKNKKHVLNLKKVNFFLLAFILITGAYYLSVINDLTVKGFALRELKLEANMLISDNNGQEAKIMSLQSYSNLSEKVKNLNMVAVSDVNYLNLTDAVIARK